MKKIEEAARKFSDGDPQESDLLEVGFRAGARYALDKMTSDAMIKIGSANGQRCSKGMASNVLHAVRKEIEGE